VISHTGPGGVVARRLGTGRGDEERTKSAIALVLPSNRHDRRTRTAVPTRRRGQYHHDERTVLTATVLRPFDDGYLIQLDPPGPGGPSPEIANRLLDATNAFFAAHGEELLDYQDALFVDGQRLQHIDLP
jgi:hypothetical protein